MKHHTLARIAILAGLTALAPVAAGQDWPQWRGPNRDGAATSFGEPAAWPEVLTEQWKVDVGLGYATPLLVGDRIYMYTRQDEDEVMMALDAGSGDVIWRTRYPTPFDLTPVKSCGRVTHARPKTPQSSGRVTRYSHWRMTPNSSLSVTAARGSSRSGAMKWPQTRPGRSLRSRGIVCSSRTCPH